MNEDIDSIELCLRKGGVIAYPTEAVWGLGCLPESEQAVRKILELKQRSWKKGLILVAANPDQIHAYVQVLSKKQKSTLLHLESNGSSAVTYLIPKSDNAPLWISGESEKIAIRISLHPIIKLLCDKLNSPLVSTSANTSGNPAARSREEVESYFPVGLDGISPGELGNQSSVSKILDIDSGELFRGAAT